MKRLSVVLALLGLLLLTTGRSRAHAVLIDAFPRPGVTLSTPPTEIVLTYNSRLASGTIAVFGAGFERYFQEAVAPVPETPTVISAVLPALPDGTYTVNWTVISSDGHEISGSYQFGVKTADAAPALPWMPLLGGFLVIALGGTLFFWRARRHDHDPADRL